MGAPLSAAQRQSVARKFNSMLAKGEISYDDLLMRMSNTLRKPEWQNPHLRDAGLHNLDTTLDALQRAFEFGGALVNRAKSTDVLSTLSGSGAPLIRTDLDSVITSIYVSEFPGWERIAKLPANGVAHNFIVSTDYDAADVSFVSELDPAPKGQGVYSVENAQIAIALTERGASLKELYAVQQSGMSYDGGKNAVDLELERGTLAIAYSFQKCMYQGTTVSGHPGTDEYGTYFSNLGVATGFQGFRGIFGNPSSAFNSYYPGTKGNVAQDQGTDTIVQAINRVVRRLMNNGSRPTAIHLSSNAAEQLAREGANILRIDQRDSAGVTLGISVDAVQTIAGRLPLVIVPGDSIGSYTAGSNSTYNGQVVEDIYVVNERTLEMRYLGAPNMVVIEIPVGVDGTLGKRYLMFGMFGLVCRAGAFNGKVRIPYVA